MDLIHRYQRGSVMFEYALVLVFSAVLIYFSLISVAKPAVGEHAAHFMQQIRLPH